MAIRVTFDLLDDSGMPTTIAIVVSTDDRELARRQAYSRAFDLTAGRLRAALGTYPTIDRVES